MDATELSRIARKCINDAADQLNAAAGAVEDMTTVGHPAAESCERHRELVACIKECVRIERDMTAATQWWINDNVPLDGQLTPEKYAKLLRYYLMFDVVDVSARDAKKDLHGCSSEEKLLRILRGSIHLHWRVVYVFEKLGPLMAQLDHLQRSVLLLRRKLEEQGIQRHIFVAHATRDKALVLDVLRRWTRVGEDACARIEGMIAAFVSKPGDLVPFKAAVENEAKFLDVLSLERWIDVDKLLSGDYTDSVIRDAIRDSRIIFVFLTKNYSEAGYLDGKERPEILKHVRARLQEPEPLRIVPIVLSLATWRKHQREWWATEGETLPCPKNVNELPNNFQSKKLQDLVVESLSDRKLLARLTGDEKRLPPNVVRDPVL